MNVLLTGVTGRLGPYVLREISGAGHQVRGLLQPGIDLPETARASLADVQCGDICDPLVWRRALEDVEAVVHLAGGSGAVPGVFEVTVESTRVMAQACHQAGVDSIVYASSNCVLGQCDRPCNLHFELEFLPINESHPLRPQADYGLSKLVAEHCLEAAARRWDMRVIAIRSAFVLLEEAEASQSWREFGEAWQVAHLWAYVHVLDCAGAYRSALETSADSLFEAFYISAADTLSDFPTQTLIERHYPAHASSAEAFPGYCSLFSWKRAESVIGFRPTRSWREYE